MCGCFNDLFENNGCLLLQRLILCNEKGSP